MNTFYIKSFSFLLIFFFFQFFNNYLYPQTKQQESIANILNPDGTLKKDAKGSFDARGFKMITDKNGKPQFIPSNKASGRNLPLTDDANWDTRFAGRGFDDEIFCIAMNGNDVYVGGNFEATDGVNITDGIAKWNGTNWVSLASGLNGPVKTIAIDGNGNVYAGGLFDHSGSQALNNIAKWNGINWTNLGSGVNGRVNTMVLSGSDLYIGGSFSSASSTINTGLVARWDGTQWNALGGGISGTSVNVLTFMGSNLYVGGNFNTVYQSVEGTISSYNLARWNGSSWDNIGNPVSSGIVYSLASNGSDLYVGGAFTNAGGSGADYLAKYNENWSQVGSNVINATVRTINIIGTDLYVGGDFDLNHADETLSYFAKWNGSNWFGLSSGFEALVNSIVISGTNIYVGGGFNHAGGAIVNHIAKWNGSSWGAMDSGLGCDGVINSIVMNGDNVFIGGAFSAVGGVTVNNIAQWDGSNWSSLGSGTNNIVYALVMKGNELYVGGRFDSPGSLIAKWTGSNWISFGQGLNGNAVYALAVNGNDVYVGGDFYGSTYTESYKIQPTKSADKKERLMDKNIYSSNIIKLNGADWVSLGEGSGTNGVVKALAMNGSDLYVGGQFSGAGNVSSTNKIARWDGSNWHSLGSGINGSEVSAITVNGNNVYVGGLFSSAGGVSSTGNIARWDGSNWNSVGGGSNAKVSALTNQSGNIIAAGSFTSVGTTSANYIASWDGSSWSVLGSGTNGNVYGMAVNGNNVYSGGDFTTAGTKQSLHFGIYTGQATQTVTQPIINLNTTSLQFGTVASNSNSDISFNITNTGAAVLTISNLLLTGSDASSFSISSGGSTPFNIQPGANSSITIRFSPKANGNKNASLQITHNASSSPSTINLSGTMGINISVNKSVIDFGSQGNLTGNKDTSITITNNSLFDTLIITSAGFVNSDNTFQIVGSTPTKIPPLGNGSIFIRFNTNSIGVFSNTLQIVNSSINNPNVSVSLSGQVLGSTISYNLNNIDFGSTGYNSTPRDTTIRLQNTGQNNLEITSIGFSFPDLTFEILNPISGDGLILPTGGFYNLVVRFKSNQTGSRSNTINISNNSTNNPLIQINVNGKVQTSTIAISPLTFDFGGLGYLMSPKDTVVHISNTGTQNLNILSAVFSTVDSCYEILAPITASGQIVAPGGSFDLKIRFKPNQVGTITNNITILNNSSNLPVVQIGLTASVLNSTISTSSSVLDFGNLGYLSDPKDTVITLLNSGKYNLKISSFNLNTTDTILTVLPQIPVEGIEIQPGSTYQIKVRISPGRIGNISNILTIQNNSSNSPNLQIKLLGNVISPYLTFNPASLDFGTTSIDNFSIIKNIEIKNSGLTVIKINNEIFIGDSTSFHILNGKQNVSLLPGQKDSLKIEFSPKTSGKKIGGVEIISNDITNEQYINLTGIAGGKPVLSASINKIDFGSLLVSKTKEFGFSIQNNGNLTLNISNKNLSGVNKDDYTLSSNLTLLERGQKDSVKIMVTGNLPAGTKTAQLQITSNDPDKSFFTLDLNAIVRVPIISKTVDKIIFDTTVVKDTVVKTFTVKNSGDTTLSVKTIFVDGPYAGDFVLFGSTFPLVIPAGTEKIISVKFAPTDKGNRYGTLSILSDDPTNPQLSIVLRGEGISNSRPIMNISSNRLEYGVVGVGKTAEAIVKVKNTGLDNLILNNISIVGDSGSNYFLQSLNFPISLKSGEETAISLKFIPSNNGSFSAKIVIKSNDPFFPEISVGANGVGESLKTPNISISTSSIDFNEIGMFLQGQASFKIENTGGDALTISSITITGSGAPDYSVSGISTPQNIAVNGEINLPVVFTPTNAGDRTAQIKIESNDPNKGEVTISLTGKGKGSTIAVSSGTLDFGSLGFESDSKDKVINILNTGNYKLKIFSVSLNQTNPHFEITNPIGSDGILIDAGQQYSFSVRFNPLNVGIWQNTLFINNNSSNSGLVSINLTGTVLQPNIITQDSIPIPKDSNTVDTNKPSTTIPVVITNGNTQFSKVPRTQATITIIDKYLTGDTTSFYILNKKVPLALGPGQSDTTDVGFRPRSPGVKTAILHIISNDITPHRQINLSGEGKGKAIIATIDKIDFGNMKYGSTKDTIILIKNKGNFDLNIASRNIIGIDKNLVEIRSANLTKLLQTDEVDSLILRINSGLGYGAKTAQLQILNNDPVNTDYRISLSENTIIPVITKNIDKIIFDTVGIGYNRDTIITIGNDGNDILTINNINIDGPYASEFSIPDQIFPLTINSKGLIKIKVRFSPSGSGNRYAGITINDNDPVNPALTVTVSGNGKIVAIPKITLSMKNIDFGILEILDKKDTVVTIKNEGTEKLQLDSLYITGKDKESFQISTPSLPLLIDPLTTDDIKVTYTPKTVSSSFAGLLRIVGNDPLNPSIEITLNGKAFSNPNISVALTQINFGSLGITSQKDTSISIKNTGTSRLNIDSLLIIGRDKDYYRIINPANIISLDPSASQVITIKFIAQTGSYLPTAKLRIVSNSTKNSIMEILLIASINRPELSSQNAQLDFGRIMIQNPKDMSVALLNKGNQDLSIDSIIIRGNDQKEFTLIKDNPILPFKLGTNEAMTIPIRFIADTLGIKTAVLEINSNDPLFPKANLVITGMVLAPKISMDIQSIDFSNVPVNINRDTLIKIRNIGDTNLIIQSIRLTDGDSSDYNILDNLNGKTLQPNNEVSFRVRFNPSKTGIRRTNMQIRTNDVFNTSIQITFMGTGIQPKLKILNAQINMGRLFVIKSKDTTFSITNAGTDVLNLKQISIIGKDSIKYNISSPNFQLPGFIKPNESINFILQFYPRDPGIKEAKIVIESNDPVDGVTNLPVLGEGIVPKIIIDNDLVGNENTDKKLDFHLDVNYPPDLIKIFFRKGGNLNYDSSAFTSASSPLFSHTLDKQLLTRNGLDYYIKILWGNYELDMPDTNYSNHPLSIQVKIEKIDSAFHSLGNRYSMYTIPAQFYRTTLLNEMIVNMGPLNNSNWRIFRYRDDTYEEYINENDWQINPGDGFWMVSKENVTFNLHNCITTPTNAPYKIRLHPGWNQIGNPFLFSVPVSAINIPKDKKVENTLLAWLIDDQNYSTVNPGDVMNEWVGYYIKNNETDSIDISISPINIQPLLSKNNSMVAQGVKSIGWKLGLEVNSDGTMNKLAVLGQSTNSYNEWDQNDISEPPLMNNKTISVRFPHSEWSKYKGNYIRDYRALTNDGGIWDLEIKNGMKINPTIQGQIKLSESGDFPKQYMICVYNNFTKKVSMYESSGYKFNFDEGDTKHFKIIVGTKEFIDKFNTDNKNTFEEIQSYSLSQNYPNPFNPTTKIEYSIPENIAVRLMIYNDLGQKVETVVDQKQSKGRYSITWNPKNLPSGVYFYRLQSGNFNEIKKMLYLR